MEKEMIALSIVILAVVLDKNFSELFKSLRNINVNSTGSVNLVHKPTEEQAQ